MRRGLVGQVARYDSRVTVDLGNIDDLIAAIRSLKTNPWTDVLIPAVSSVIGILAGFFLSVAKTGYDRKTARRDEITGDIRLKRQEAVDTVMTELRWMSANPGFFGSPPDWAPHLEARRIGPELFALTGKASDEEVSPEARNLFRVLEATYKSYVRPMDAQQTNDWSRLTEAIQKLVRTEVATIRSGAQEWIDRDRDSDWMAEMMKESRKRIFSARDFEGADEENLGQWFK